LRRLEKEIELKKIEGIEGKRLRGLEKEIELKKIEGKRLIEINRD
jgi:hypothetical protein